MKVKCIKNTGESLRDFEYKELEKEMLGRFGATGFTGYDDLCIGKEYLVMGIIVFETYQAYLLNESVYPCQLFEVIDSNISANWHFRIIEKNENIYPFIQAIFGYPELCSDKKSYENLIVEKDEDAILTYFRRKIELEKELEE